MSATPRFAFVGGLHRSGTTLVHRCLASHPDVAAFADTGVPEDEGQHLQDALPPARLLGGPGRFARHPLAALGPVPPDQVVALRARLLATWEPLWGSGRVRIAKSPPDLLRGPLLQQLFPGAPLVVVRRHPLAVALATRAMGRTQRSLEVVDLVEHWLIAHERLDVQRPLLAPLVELRLERLVAAPRPTLAPAFAALGLDPPKALPPMRADPDARYRRLARFLLASPTRRADRARLRALAPRVAVQGYDLLEFAGVE